MSTAKKDAALTVLTVACGYDDSLRAWVAQRIRAYAARHDYTAQVFLRAWDERCDSSSWEKLNRTRAALRGGAPYVLTVDADAVILPTAGSLTDQCAALDAAGNTWAMSDDENGPNGGVVLYKNDARTLAMLDEMSAQEQALRSAWLAPFHWEQRAFMYAIGSSHWALKNRLQGWLSLPSSPNSAAYAATKGALDPQWNTRLADASPRRSIVHLAGGPRAKATKPAMMRALLRLGATNAGVVHRFTPGTVATRGIVAEARGAWAGQGFRLDEVTDRSVALGHVARLAQGVCGLPPQVGRRYLRAYTHPNTSFVQRADMWRYARLLTQGGVYADGDASPTPAFLGEYARHISEGGEI